MGFPDSDFFNYFRSTPVCFQCRISNTLTLWTKTSKATTNRIVSRFVEIRFLVNKDITMHEFFSEVPIITNLQPIYVLHLVKVFRVRNACSVEEASILFNIVTEICRVSSLERCSTYGFILVIVQTVLSE